MCSKGFVGYRGSSLDSNEHYYGRSNRFSETASNFEPSGAFVQPSDSDLPNELSLKELYRPEAQLVNKDLPQPVPQVAAEAPPSSTQEVYCPLQRQTFGLCASGSKSNLLGLALLKESYVPRRTRFPTAEPQRAWCRYQLRCVRKSRQLLRLPAWVHILKGTPPRPSRPLSTAKIGSETFLE